jgi:hypothetical protein
MFQKALATIGHRGDSRPKRHARGPAWTRLGATFVERYRLARRIVHRGQLGALDPCESEATAQLPRELPVRPSDPDHRTSAASFLVHRFEERSKLGLDGDAASGVRLRGLQLAGLAVEAPVDVDHAPNEIDVFPPKGAAPSGSVYSSSARRKASSS